MALVFSNDNLSLPICQMGMIRERASWGSVQTDESIPLGMLRITPVTHRVCINMTSFLIVSLEWALGGRLRNTVHL